MNCWHEAFGETWLQLVPAMVEIEFERHQQKTQGASLHRIRSVSKNLKKKFMLSEKIEFKQNDRPRCLFASFECHTVLKLPQDAASNIHGLIHVPPAKHGTAHHPFF